VAVPGTEPALIEWLTRADHGAVTGWAPDPPLEALHCHPDLVARLSEIARPVAGTARRFVAGCPVVHHPRGRPIAAASGTNWLAVRSDRPAGALAPAAPEASAAALGAGWQALDPWTSDVAFARGTDLLRGHVIRAYELAEAD